MPQGKNSWKNGNLQNNKWTLKMLLELIDIKDAKNNVSKLYSSYFLCMATFYIQKVS